jgi:hypothetical protein
LALAVDGLTSSCCLKMTWLQKCVIVLDNDSFSSCNIIASVDRQVSLEVWFYFLLLVRKNMMKQKCDD